MVSIIVPVYNIEKYLDSCVKSILGSTYRDFELILVDDGSKDGSGAICDNFAVLDKRVRVVHQENAGVSAARNAGMRMAVGENIMFVDGDDMIHPRMIEILKNALDGGDYDFSMVYGERVKEDDIASIRLMLNAEVGDAQEYEISQSDFLYSLVGATGKVSLDRFGSLVCWNKLFKRAFVQELFFDTSIRNSEDFEWSTRMGMRLNKAIVVDLKLYVYIQRRGSAMLGGITDASVKSIDVYKNCMDILPVQYRSHALKLLYSYMFVIRRYSANTRLEKEVKAACSGIYNQTIREFLSSDINWASKLRSVVGFHFPRVYNFVLNKLEARAIEKQ